MQLVMRRRRMAERSHTLISLGRLPIEICSEQERTELSDAYTFLRSLEHRLQMEHGLQTHTVPVGRDQRVLVARRMNFSEPDAVGQLDQAIALQTTNVRRAYDRVFQVSDKDEEELASSQLSRRSNIAERLPGADETSARTAAKLLRRVWCPPVTVKPWFRNCRQMSLALSILIALCRCHTGASSLKSLTARSKFRLTILQIATTRRLIRILLARW